MLHTRRFFVGYISRPAGALIFGHLGDTKGRGTCLLISVLVMGIPTVRQAAVAAQLLSCQLDVAEQIKSSCSC